MAQPPEGVPPPYTPPPPVPPPPGMPPLGAGLPPNSPNGVIMLVLAILAWVLCGCFTSIPVTFWAKGEMDRYPNDTNVRAAYWIALINVILSVLALIAGAVMAVVFPAFFRHFPH